MVLNSLPAFRPFALLVAVALATQSVAPEFYVLSNYQPSKPGVQSSLTTEAFSSRPLFFRMSPRRGLWAFLAAGLVLFATPSAAQQSEELWRPTRVFGSSPKLPVNSMSVRIQKAVRRATQLVKADGGLELGAEGAELAAVLAKIGPTSVTFLEGMKDGPIMIIKRDKPDAVPQIVANSTSLNDLPEDLLVGVIVHEAKHMLSRQLVRSERASATMRSLPEDPRRVLNDKALQTKFLWALSQTAQMELDAFRSEVLVYQRFSKTQGLSMSDYFSRLSKDSRDDTSAGKYLRILPRLVNNDGVINEDEYLFDRLLSNLAPSQGMVSLIAAVSADAVDSLSYDPVISRVVVSGDARELRNHLGFRAWAVASLRDPRHWMQEGAVADPIEPATSHNLEFNRSELSQPQAPASSFFMLFPFMGLLSKTERRRLTRRSFRVSA